MTYLEEVQKGMDYLAEQDNVVFVGQAVEYKGTAVTHQVKNYDPNKLIEMPVAEDFQGGFCLGLTLQGYVPVCIFPRMNFAICATNQIINHMDKWELMHPDNKPHIIIKTVVGSKEPLDPGHQHKANYAEQFVDMTETMDVYDLSGEDNEVIFSTYKKAYDNPGIHMIVEYGDLYK